MAAALFEDCHIRYIRFKWLVTEISFRFKISESSKDHISCRPICRHDSHYPCLVFVFSNLSAHSHSSHLRSNLPHSASRFVYKQTWWARWHISHARAVIGWYDLTLGWSPLDSTTCGNSTQGSPLRNTCHILCSFLILSRHMYERLCFLPGAWSFYLVDIWLDIQINWAADCADEDRLSEWHFLFITVHDQFAAIKSYLLLSHSLPVLSLPLPLSLCLYCPISLLPPTLPFQSPLPLSSPTLHSHSPHPLSSPTLTLTCLQDCLQLVCNY